jgi:hypothetical protein
MVYLTFIDGGAFGSAFVAEDDAGVVEAEQMEDGCMEVMHMHAVAADGTQAQFISLAQGSPAF